MTGFQINYGAPLSFFKILYILGEKIEEYQSRTTATFEIVPKEKENTNYCNQ
jgi:hypothetical protein